MLLRSISKSRNPLENFLLSLEERRIPSGKSVTPRKTSRRLSFAVLILIRFWPSAAIMNFPARPDSSHTHSAQFVIAVRQSGRGAAAAARCLSGVRPNARERRGRQMIKYSDEAPPDAGMFAPLRFHKRLAHSVSSRAALIRHSVCAMSVQPIKEKDLSGHKAPPLFGLIRFPFVELRMDFS